MGEIGKRGQKVKKTTGKYRNRCLTIEGIQMGKGIKKALKIGELWGN